MRTAIRNCQLHIDSSAIEHNLELIRRLAAGSKVMPVIKANAYGHGVSQVLQACVAADGFAVAMISEAVAIRQSGCDKPVMVFHGCADMEEVALAARYELQVAVHSDHQLDLLAAWQGTPLTVWLKLDTGMHRLGIAMESAMSCYQRLDDLPQVARVNVMSHFANADEPTHALNRVQLDNLTAIREALAQADDVSFSLANSAAIVSQPDSHLDWVRPGIMLYGGSPVLGRSAADIGLRPAMRFVSSLISLRHCRAGDAIGYGSTWVCPEDMPVGVVAAGYADGYPRHAPAGTPVAIGAQRAPIIGRVSMDSICVDLRGIDASAGDEVELWGTGIAVDEVAASAGTIAYELLCKAGLPAS